jgi:hypothetical protein
VAGTTAPASSAIADHHLDSSSEPSEPDTSKRSAWRSRAGSLPSDTKTVSRPRSETGPEGARLGEARLGEDRAVEDAALGPAAHSSAATLRSQVPIQGMGLTMIAGCEASERSAICSAQRRGLESRLVIPRRTATSRQIGAPGRLCVTMTVAPSARAQRATWEATASDAPLPDTWTRRTPGAPLRSRSSSSANPTARPSGDSPQRGCVCAGDEGGVEGLR